MITNHVDVIDPDAIKSKPLELPRITSQDLCKAKYREGEQLCYTGWLLHIFLPDESPMPLAYKEFRLKTMDLLYGKYSEDHAVTADQRANVFNEVAESLGYSQIETKQWLAKYDH